MNSEDFRRSYASSYFGLDFSELKEQLKPYNCTQAGSIIPCTSPQHDGLASSIVCVSKRDDGHYQQVRVMYKKYSSSLVDSSYFHGHVPPTGMVQGIDTVAYLKLSPIRQFQRGYATKNYQLSTLNAYLTGQNISPTALSIIWHVYNPMYTPWFQALSGLAMGERIGYAVDKYLGVALDAGYEDPLIMYRSDKVGYVDGDGNPCVHEGSISDAGRDYIYKITGLEVKIV